MCYDLGGPGDDREIDGRRMVGFSDPDGFLGNFLQHCIVEQSGSLGSIGAKEHLNCVDM